VKKVLGVCFLPGWLRVLAAQVEGGLKADVNLSDGDTELSGTASDAARVRVR
jgi:hypothetical protein